jgi:multidrug resistance protein MdtO
MAQRGALEQDLALMHYEPSWVRPEREWIAERRDVLARISALEGPMFLLAERWPGDVAIDGWLDQLACGMPQTASEADAAADAALRVAPNPASSALPDPAMTGIPNPAMSVIPNPASPEAAVDDDIRTALLHLGNARLNQLEHAASNDAAKDLTTHAPA